MSEFILIALKFIMLVIICFFGILSAFYVYHGSIVFVFSFLCFFASGATLLSMNDDDINPAYEE